MTLDVIIPVKARPSIIQCLQSLVAAPLVRQILVCDGATEPEEAVTLPAPLSNMPEIKILAQPMLGFNKSRLLNYGLAHATVDVVLVSDADIIWSSETLETLYNQVVHQPDIICSVAEVRESDPGAIALRRERYTYDIRYTPDQITLAIQPVLGNVSQQRPGCGLLCAHRSTLWRLGGYKELFQGWGWEDQDLLIRAQLAGIQVVTAGRVIHLSHGDAQRNRFHDHHAPSNTRNYNIVMAIASLAQGQFRGNLPSSEAPLPTPRNLQLELPPTLRTWLHEQLHQSITDHHLSTTGSALANAAKLVAAWEQP
jgi:glycosyltransferase involved in cell wall biosynthesis